jgi:predicted transcriptional regulator
LRPTLFDVDVGQLLREARLEQGFAQAQLARRAGTTQTYVSRLERGGQVARTEREDGVVALTVHCRSARDFVPAAFDAASATQSQIRHVEVVPVSLEDVFISLTGRALRE